MRSIIEKKINSGNFQKCYNLNLLQSDSNVLNANDIMYREKVVALCKGNDLQQGKAIKATH